MLPLVTVRCGSCHEDSFNFYLYFNFIYICSKVFLNTFPLITRQTTLANWLNSCWLHHQISVTICCLLSKPESARMSKMFLLCHLFKGCLCGWVCISVYGLQFTILIWWRKLNRNTIFPFILKFALYNPVYLRNSKFSWKKCDMPVLMPIDSANNIFMIWNT